MKHAGKDDCRLHASAGQYMAYPTQQRCSPAALTAMQTAASVWLQSNGSAPTALTSAALPVSGGEVACSRLRPGLTCMVP